MDVSIADSLGILQDNVQNVFNKINVARKPRDFNKNNFVRQ